jgi:cytochrome c-type biogenesis protein CcmH/NrfG
MQTLNAMLPGLVVLILGLVGGGWVAMALRRRAPVEPMRDVIDDAEERVSRLMAHLRELSLHQGRTDGETYAKDQADLEVQAAQAMRARDELLAKKTGAPSKAAPAAVEPESTSPMVRWLHARPALRGALWASGVFLVGGSLFYFVQRDQHPGGRTMGGASGGEQAMGEQMPGGASAGEAAQQRVQMPPFITAEMPSQNEVQGLIARLQQNPQDMAATVRLGHVLIAGRMFEEAKIMTDRALQFDPGNKEALAHAAALRSVQDPDGGLALLDALVKQNPSLADAWLFRGMIAMRAGNTAVMQESFKKYVAVAPEGPEREHVRSMLSGSGTATAAKP